MRTTSALVIAFVAAAHAALQAPTGLSTASTAVRCKLGY